jgi:hypothetical protein
MVASLVRLLHSGPQDERLLPKKGPRDVKAYERVLVRAGRMTTQWSRLDFQQQPQFGQQAVCRLLKKGELISRLYVVVTLPDIFSAQAAAALASPGFVGPRFGWTNSIGHALIQSVTLDIGGTKVETLDSRLLEIHDEFDTPLEKLVNKDSMIGRIQDNFQETSLGNTPVPLKLYISIPLWFCRGDLASSLPIDAIHVDEVRLSIQFRPLTGCYYTNSRAPVASVIPTVEGSALWPILGSKFYTTTPTGNSVIPPGTLYTTAKEPVVGPVYQIPGITMPTVLSLGDTYLLAEYIYLDKPEAVRFRLGDIQIPVPQHYRIDPYDTRGFPQVNIPLEIPNPTRHLFFMAQNYGALAYNAHFLATKDLASPITNPAVGLSKDETFVPWWPDCEGLNARYAAPLIPGFSRRGSEPLTSIELLYEGKYVRTSTENTALYRSILPSLEERKSPWINRYMYCIPFGVQSAFFPPSVPMGEANMNRIANKELRLGIAGNGVSAQRCWIYIYAETYNILRIFGGRAGMLFAY